jgi:hypothetical protein
MITDSFPSFTSIMSASQPGGGVTGSLTAHNIGYVPSRTAQTLTKRRAVDFCRVATALCPPAQL